MPQLFCECGNPRPDRRPGCARCREIEAARNANVRRPLSDAAAWPHQLATQTIDQPRLAAVIRRLNHYGRL